MAEHSKGGLFTRAQKTLTRTKTKVLQNLGKAERTSDEQFDEHVHKLERQQDVANKFQKELRNYVNCAKAMQTASKSLYQVLLETYEQEWLQEEVIRGQLDSLELMWNNFTQNLHESVQDPVTTYMSHFPTLKHRISKRGRKLVDFDNARHNLEVHQNAKKKDEAKIKKAKEELDEAKHIYEQMNNELHQDLPMFYNSRVNFYANEYEKLFSTEEIFHTEVSKLCHEISSVAEKLAKENEANVFQPRPLSSAISTEGTVVNGHPENGNSGYDSPSPASTPTSPEPKDVSNGTKENEQLNTSEASADGIYENSDLVENTQPVATKEAEESKTEEKSSEQEVKKEEELQTSVQTQKEEEKVNGEVQDDEPQGSLDAAPNYPPPKPPTDEPPADMDDVPVKSEESESKTEDVQTSSDPASEAAAAVTPSGVTNNDAEKDEDVDKHQDDNLYEVPTSNKPVEEAAGVSPPEGLLYEVKATHPYNNADEEDELSFDTGEIIYVVSYENPDDQDDGWLMGVKKSNGKKGVFPENFTKKL